MYQVSGIISNGKMNFYCPHCSRLLAKKNTSLVIGESIISECPVCQKTVVFRIKGRAVGKVLTDKKYNDKIEA